MDARLRSKAEHVEEHPDLHRRAVLDPAEVAVSKRDPLARWRDTPQAFREDAAEMTGMRNPDLILPHAAHTLAVYNVRTATAFDIGRVGKGNAMSILTVIGIFVVLIPFLYRSYKDQIEERN